MPLTPIDERVAQLQILADSSPRVRDRALAMIEQLRREDEIARREQAVDVRGQMVNRRNVQGMPMQRSGTTMEALQGTAEGAMGVPLASTQRDAFARGGEDPGLVGAFIDASQATAINRARGFAQVAADVVPGVALSQEGMRAASEAERDLQANLAAGGMGAKLGQLGAGAAEFALAGHMRRLRGIPLAGATLIGTTTGLSSYGEARDMGLSPGEAALRATGQGGLAGTSLAVAPFSRMAGAAPAAMSPLRAGARAAGLNVADAVPQSLVMDVGGGAVDIAQGAYRHDEAQKQLGVDRVTSVPENFPEMAAAGLLMGGIGGFHGQRAAQRGARLRDDQIIADEAARRAAVEAARVEQAQRNQSNLEAWAGAKANDAAVLDSLAAEQQAGARERARREAVLAERRDAEAAARLAEGEEAAIAASRPPVEMVEQRQAARAAAQQAVAARRQQALQQIEAELQAHEADPAYRNATENADFMRSEVARMEREAAQAGALGRAAEHRDITRELVSRRKELQAVEATAAEARRKRTQLERRRDTLRQLIPATPEVPRAVPAPEPSVPATPAAPERAPGDGAGGAGNLRVPEVPLPGAGDGVRAAGGGPRPGEQRSEPAGPARVTPEPGSRGALEIEARELDQQIAEARAGTAGRAVTGAEAEATRAKLDASFKATQEQLDSALGKAKVAEADAAAEAKAHAQMLAGEAVKIAGERVNVAKARLTAAKRAAPGDDLAIMAAKNDLKRAELDAERVRQSKVEADNLRRQAKAAVSDVKLTEARKQWSEHAERLRPSLEAGMRSTVDPKGKLEIDHEGGKARFVDRDGNTVAEVELSLKPRQLTAADFPSWAESMGGREGLLRWFNESPSGKKALRMLDGRRPARVEDIPKTLGPADLVKFMGLEPAGGDYQLGTGRIRVFDTASLSEVQAVVVGQHEMNHRVAHGVLLSAMRSPEMRGHLDVLAKAVGVDPRQDGNLVPFLEKVRKLYANWRQRYSPELAQIAKVKAAAEAARRGNSPVDRALAALSRGLTAILRFMRIGGSGEAKLNLDQVFRDMADGKLLPVTREPVKGEGSAFSTREDAAEVGPRRPLSEGEADPNLSLGGIRPENRGLAKQLSLKYAKPTTRVGRDMIDDRADEIVRQAGGSRKAAAEIVAKVKEMYGNEAEMAAELQVIESRMQELLDRQRGGGSWQGKEAEALTEARMAAAGNVAATLASLRDRFDTPQHRAEAVYKSVWRPTVDQAAWFVQQRKLIAKHKANGDVASERKAAQVYENAVARLVELQNQKIQRMKQWGLDITDGPSLESLLGDEKTAFAVMRDISDIQLLADPNATKRDWILANYRAHLLGDPLVTQPQQFLGNALAALENTIRVGASRPRALIAALRGGALAAGVTNAIESFKLGKNAWVHRIEGEELGRAENYYRPADWYSRAVRFVSFDIMAAIDGGFQRYNAQLEAAQMVYKSAREAGRSADDALSFTTDILRNGMGDDIAVEAMFRSLPSTFQELAIKRAGAADTWMDKVSSGANHLTRILDDGAGELLAAVHERSRDPITGKARPVPISGFVFPFVKTSLAIARAASRRSFLGSASVIAETVKYFQMKRGGAGVRDLEWQAEQIKRRAFECVIVGGVAMHALAIMLDATGTDIDDPEGAKTGRAKGEKTVNLFGRRVSYARLEPFATPLAMAANGIKAIREGRNPLPGEMRAILKLGSDLAWFRTLAGIGGAIDKAMRPKGKTGEQQDEQTTGIFDAIASGVVSTAISATPVIGQAGLRNMLKPGDEVMRRTDGDQGPIDRVKAEFGFDRTPMRDVWGRKVLRGPIEAGGAANIAERAIAGGLGRAPLYRPTAADRWMQERGLSVPAWSPRGADGKDLPDEQRDAFIAEAGPMLLSAVESIRNSRPDVKPEVFTELVKRHKAAITAKVKRKLGLQ